MTADPSPTPAAATPSPSHDGAPSPRLLIADDDPFMRAALAAALRDEFEIVATAADAHDAVALAEQHRPDAALVDLDMPGGGINATRGIRSRSPHTAVVILSGDESDGAVRDVINAGATTYLRKGTARADVARALRTSIAAVEMQRQGAAEPGQGAGGPAEGAADPGQT